MSKEINISSNNVPINIEVFSKDKSCKINVDKDLSLYYSSLAKKWAISDSLVDNEDYSAKYYAQNIKQNVESITSNAKNEMQSEILVAKEQVNLAKEQVDFAKQQAILAETKGAEQVNLAKEQVALAKEQVVLAKEAVDDAQEIADSINGNFSTINLSNINEEGEAVIKNLANEACISLPIGSIVSLFSTNTYVPEGLLPCNGLEYSQEQFSQFYTNYLLKNKILTCSYEEYSLEITQFGKCAKFGLDTVNGRFKVPSIPDGTFIQSAMSSNELGKSYNAGLPNIEGSLINIHCRENNITGKAIDSAEGAFKVDGNGSGPNGGMLGASNTNVTLDASLSNPIYGNSNTVQPNAIALRYFVVVATGSINQSQMDWSEWASGLQGKLNADHSNDNKPYIIETYINGASGYLVYSNGFCEQWGQHPASSSNLVLLKPYKDTNYMFNVFARCLRNIAGDTFHSQIRSKTSSQVEIYVAQYGSDGVISSNYIHEWFAVGYID